MRQDCVNVVIEWKPEKNVFKECAKLGFAVRQDHSYSVNTLGKPHLNFNLLYAFRRHFLLQSEPSSLNRYLRHSYLDWKNLLTILIIFVFFRNGSIHSGKHGSSVDDEIRLGLLNATCNAVANKQKQQQMILTQNHHQEQQQRKVLVVDDSDTPRFELIETHS